MSTRTRIPGLLVLVALIVLTFAAFAVSVCAQQEDETAEPIEGLQSDNDLKEVTGKIFYESAAGDFEVYLPSGCSRYRERIPTENFEDEGYEMVKMAIFVYCDRQARRNEGCSVTAYVDDDLESGTPADSDFVQARVVSILQKYNAHVVDQKPLHEVLVGGPRIEGIDVLATDAEERGQVWVRGLLIEGDVYILSAWRAEGPLAGDPDYIGFFESFRAHM